jgi:hypothetical protein
MKAHILLILEYLSSYTLQLATYYNTTTKIASIYFVAEALSTILIKVQVFNA